MGDKPIPAVFVSHGSPTTPIEDIPARTFLRSLGSQYSNVSSVLCISAHWENQRATVNAVDFPETIHDFYGFPDELYRLKYPARGDKKLARRVVDVLDEAGIACDVDSSRGLDHGAWIPLMLMYPNASKPVVQLSIQHNLDTREHLDLGKALASIRKEGVLVLGSGGAVHPLGYADFWSGKGTDRWAISFDDWLTKAVLKGASESLVNYRSSAPYPERAHPRADHFMPLLTAFGAGGPGARGKVLHRSWYYGDLGMGAYAFAPRDE